MLSVCHSTVCLSAYLPACIVAVAIATNPWLTAIVPLSSDQNSPSPHSTIHITSPLPLPRLTSPSPSPSPSPHHPHHLGPYPTSPHPHPHPHPTSHIIPCPDSCFCLPDLLPTPASWPVPVHHLTSPHPTSHLHCTAPPPAHAPTPASWPVPVSPGGAVDV